MTYPLDFPLAHGLGRVNAVFREQPADFCVEEILGFEPTGDGEHLWLLVEKTALNTVDVTRALSEVTGVRDRDIGYAGLKDKQAVARQWFSLAGVKPLQLTDLANGRISILKQVQNTRKLRQGSHRGNRFSITLRHVTGEPPCQLFTEVLASKGVPNYFGPQRFGFEGKNVERAAALFGGDKQSVSRFQRGLYLSAARSYLFNAVLARRVRDNNWDNVLAGDIMALAGSSSIFAAQPDDEALLGRLAALDIHPTGPLWGKGESADSAVRELEQSIADSFPVLKAGLELSGMKQERRALRLVPEQLRISSVGDGQLVIEFALPKGAYATSVLREMVDAAGL